MKSLTPLILGLFFGVVLVKTEVASWFRIQKMFRFEEAYMFLVMASAIAVGALSLILIRKLLNTLKRLKPMLTGSDLNIPTI